MNQEMQEFAIIAGQVFHYYFQETSIQHPIHSRSIETHRRLLVCLFRMQYRISRRNRRLLLPLRNNLKGNTNQVWFFHFSLSLSLSLLSVLSSELFTTLSELNYSLALLRWEKFWVLCDAWVDKVYIFLYRPNGYMCFCHCVGGSLKSKAKIGGWWMCSLYIHHKIWDWGLILSKIAIWRHGANT